MAGGKASSSQFPGDRSQWEDGTEGLLRNLVEAVSSYCDGISSSSIVQLLLKFAHKEKFTSFYFILQ